MCMGNILPILIAAVPILDGPTNSAFVFFFCLSPAFSWYTSVFFLNVSLLLLLSLPGINVLNSYSCSIGMSMFKYTAILFKHTSTATGVGSFNPSQ